MADGDNSDKNDEIIGMNIHQRIHAIRGSVGALILDATCKIMKDGKKVGEFPYQTHDSVTSHIVKAFNIYRVDVSPTVLEHNHNGNRVELKVETTFINIDDPKDTTSIITIGYGVDASDKGPGKALSYATKSAYLKKLMLNSGDDEGGEQAEHDPTDTRTSEVDDAKAKALGALESAAVTYKAAINGATTAKELRSLKSTNSSWLDNAQEVTRKYFDDAHNSRMQAIEAST